MVSIMCECLNRFPSWKVLIGEMVDEIVELIKEPWSLKEWSDVGRGLERFVEKAVGRRNVINLGGGLNRKVQAERVKRNGCIRSERHLLETGGMCVTKFQRLHG